MRFLTKMFAVVLLLGGAGLTGYEIYNVIFTENLNYALHVSLLVVGALLCLASNVWTLK